MRIVFIIFAFVLCISGSAHAITGTGQLGVEVITNVFSLNPEEAVKFCAENTNNPNCDILIADDEAEEMRFVAFDVEAFEQDQSLPVLTEQLSDTEYPIRMISFE